MSYTPRTYPDLVRDLLTVLTGGTVREVVTAPADRELLVPERLSHRPVRRVSHLQGFVPFPRNSEPPEGADPRGVPYKFTAADFELVARSPADTELDSIRFRENGRHPTPRSPLTVNYYPIQTDPVPLTDLNVGSVTRTLVETFARELAMSDLALEAIYKSAFFETADGSSLDKVVALVGVRRLPVGHPVVTLRFTRRSGTPGRITIPAGSAITDGAANRFLTLAERSMEPNESTLDVLAGGESAATEEVDEGTLTRQEIIIAGLSEVTNLQPARRLAAPESDDELRRRARGALHGAVRGTRDALEFRLRSIDGVKDVAVTEMPNGVAGEVLVTIAFADESDAVTRAVADAIEDVRPAGIRVIVGSAGKRRVTVSIALTLAGTGVAAAELPALTSAVETRVADLLVRLPPGGRARRAQLTALAMQDPRIIDAEILLRPDGGSDADEIQLAADETLDLVRPFTFQTTAERTAVPGATTARVTAGLPVHLQSGVTAEQARTAIDAAIRAHLATRTGGAPLTLDSLAAAIRDDTRYVLLRGDALLTVETADARFQQLTDGAGSYTPALNETLTLDAVTLDVREGEV